MLLTGFSPRKQDLELYLGWRSRTSLCSYDWASTKLVSRACV
jgi:hypothetical protein